MRPLTGYQPATMASRPRRRSAGNSYGEPWHHANPGTVRVEWAGSGWMDDDRLKSLSAGYKPASAPPPAAPYADLPPDLAEVFREVDARVGRQARDLAAADDSPIQVSLREPGVPIYVHEPPETTRLSWGTIVPLAIIAATISAALLKLFRVI